MKEIREKLLYIGDKLDEVLEDIWELQNYTSYKDKLEQIEDLKTGDEIKVYDLDHKELLTKMIVTDVDQRMVADIITINGIYKSVRGKTFVNNIYYEHGANVLRIVKTGKHFDSIPFDYDGSIEWNSEDDAK